MENIHRKYFAFKLCHFLWYYYFFFLHIYIERTSLFISLKISGIVLRVTIYNLFLKQMQHHGR